MGRDIFTWVICHLRFRKMFTGTSYARPFRLDYQQTKEDWLYWWTNNSCQSKVLGTTFQFRGFRKNFQSNGFRSTGQCSGYSMTVQYSGFRTTGSQVFCCYLLVLDLVSKISKTLISATTVFVSLAAFDASTLFGIL